MNKNVIKRKVNDKKKKITKEKSKNEMGLTKKIRIRLFPSAPPYTSKIYKNKETVKTKNKKNSLKNRTMIILLEYRKSSKEINTKDIK